MSTSQPLSEVCEGIFKKLEALRQLVKGIAKGSKVLDAENGLDYCLNNFVGVQMAHAARMIEKGEGGVMSEGNVAVIENLMNSCALILGQCERVASEAMGPRSWSEELESKFCQLWGGFARKLSNLSLLLPMSKLDASLVLGEYSRTSVTPAPPLPPRNNALTEPLHPKPAHKAPSEKALSIANTAPSRVAYNETGAQVNPGRTWSEVSRFSIESRMDQLRRRQRATGGSVEVSAPVPQRPATPGQSSDTTSVTASEVTSATRRPLGGGQGFEERSGGDEKRPPPHSRIYSDTPPPYEAKPLVPDVIPMQKSRSEHGDALNTDGNTNVFVAERLNINIYGNINVGGPGASITPTNTGHGSFPATFKPTQYTGQSQPQPLGQGGWLYPQPPMPQAAYPDLRFMGNAGFGNQPTRHSQPLAYHSNKFSLRESLAMGLLDALKPETKCLHGYRHFKVHFACPNGCCAMWGCA